MIRFFLENFFTNITTSEVLLKKKKAFLFKYSHNVKHVWLTTTHIKVSDDFKNNSY